MLTTTDGAELTPSRSRAAALLRGVLQAYVTSLLPYAVSLSIFLILATVIPPISYFIFLLWFASAQVPYVPPSFFLIAVKQ